MWRSLRVLRFILRNKPHFFWTFLLDHRVPLIACVEKVNILVILSSRRNCMFVYNPLEWVLGTDRVNWKLITIFAFTILYFLRKTPEKLFKLDWFFLWRNSGELYLAFFLRLLVNIRNASLTRRSWAYRLILICSTESPRRSLNMSVNHSVFYLVNKNIYTSNKFTQYKR